MAKKNNGWNPSGWLHDMASQEKNREQRQKLHATAAKWPTWHDDDAIQLNDTQNGQGHKFYPDKKKQLAASLPGNKTNEAARLKNKVDEYKTSPAAGTSKLTNTKNVVKKRNEIADTLLRQKNRKIK